MALLLCAIQFVFVSSQRLDVTDRLAFGALASRAFLISIVIFDLRKVIANSTSKCKITKCFCKSTPLVLRNSISFLVSHQV